MDFIDQFIVQYRREFDFFERAGRLVAQQLDARLQASGIRAIVTSRAKSPKRLEAKVRQRAVKHQYTTTADIYADLVDLAGVRVALYFPGERKEVDKIVRDQFDLKVEAKEFVGTTNPTYAKRFSGYWATHYRIQLRQSALSEIDQRFADARVEIQVASVLMHAWAEVEHDLVYKPFQGSLSDDELAILDEVNGLVLAGEIALERLQRAAEVRVAGKGTRFNNHYDLASFLLEAARPLLQNGDVEPALGDVDLLFTLLAKLQIATSDALRTYVSNLHPDIERRPIAEQITDQILAADPGRYATYAEIRAQSDGKEEPVDTATKRLGTTGNEETADVVGAFILQWSSFERFLRELSKERGLEPRIAIAPTQKMLYSFNVFDDRLINEIGQIRQVRNSVVHGLRVPSRESVQQSGAMLKRILDNLLTDPRDDVRKAAERTLRGGDATS